MALALYRKYRPATFSEVVGQEHVTEPLRIALAAGKVNHAYLFSGPRGCGKTSSARILARSLNCVQGPTPDPCGVCRSCIALAPEGPGSLDVVELDAASHGGVEDTRDLRDKAFYMPAESRYRVFIIDEAHMVTSQGFNALLKIVEEPPEHLVFIFATTEPDKVLTTIRSRTHHYPFRLIPPVALRALLEKLCDEEGVTVEPAVFPLVIRAGGGSARDSLSILDQLLAGAGPEGVTYARAVALLGVTDASLLDEIVDAFAAGDGASVFGAVDKVVEAGHDPRRFAADLLQRFRDLVIMVAVPDAAEKGIIDAPEDQLQSMVEQAQRLGAATLTRLSDILHTGLVEMRGTTSPRLVLELMCARMLLPAASLQDSALLQRLERVERTLASGVPLPATAATAVAAPTAPTGAPAGVSAPVAVGPTGPAEDVRDTPVRPVPEPASRPAYRRPSLRSDAPANPTAPVEPAPAAPASAVAPLPTAPVIGSAAAGTAPTVPVEAVPSALGLPPKPVLSSIRPTAAAEPPAVEPPAAEPPALEPPAAEPVPAEPVAHAPAVAESRVEESGPADNAEIAVEEPASGPVPTEVVAEEPVDEQATGPADTAPVLPDASDTSAAATESGPGEADVTDAALPDINEVLPVTEEAPADLPGTETQDPDRSDASGSVAETSIVEAPVAEVPMAVTAEAPVAESPVAEVPMAVTAEAPVAESPVAETPVVETPVAGTPVRAAGPVDPYADEEWPLPEEPMDEFVPPEPDSAPARRGAAAPRSAARPSGQGVPSRGSAAPAGVSLPNPPAQVDRRPVSAVASPAPAPVAPPAPAATPAAAGRPAGPADAPVAAPAPSAPAAPQRPAQAPAAAPAAAQAGSGGRASQVDVTDVRRTWQEILAAVQKRRRTTQILLASATVADVSGNALHLTMPSAGMARRVLEAANADLLRAALKEVLGVEWAIRCEAGSDAPPSRSVPVRQAAAPSTPASPSIDDDIPDDFDASVAESPESYVVRDPEDVAIELLQSELGAVRIDP